MNALQRNELVWLTKFGWQRVLELGWDSEGQSVLQHWAVAQLPLVVCRQRVDHMPPTISLGLPAPSIWNRRKLELECLPGELRRRELFPSLEPIAQRNADLWEIEDFLVTMRSLNLPIQVYGSFGWQHLTGMDYVRPSSDLDLRVQVPDHAMAKVAARALSALRLAIRVDGELAFPDGSAIAWREYLQWAQGEVDRVLVKSRTSVGLMESEALLAMALSSSP
jgi:phosphoribosyl-dephospho-CoA transferase